MQYRAGEIENGTEFRPRSRRETSQRYVDDGLRLVRRRFTVRIAVRVVSSARRIAATVDARPNLAIASVAVLSLRTSSTDGKVRKRASGSACRERPTLLIVHEPSGSRAILGPTPICSPPLYINPCWKPPKPLPGTATAAVCGSAHRNAPSRSAPKYIDAGLLWAADLRLSGGSEGRKTMSLDRRELLKATLAASAAVTLAPVARADINFDPQPGAWRTFQVVTRIEIGRAVGKTQAWIPVAAVNEPDWFKSLSTTGPRTGEHHWCAKPNSAPRCFTSNGRTGRQTQSSR